MNSLASDFLFFSTYNNNEWTLQFVIHGSDLLQAPPAHKMGASGSKDGFPLCSFENFGCAEDRKARMKRPSEHIPIIPVEVEPVRPVACDSVSSVLQHGCVGADAARRQVLRSATRLVLRCDVRPGQRMVRASAKCPSAPCCGARIPSPGNQNASRRCRPGVWVVSTRPCDHLGMAVAGVLHAERCRSVRRPLKVRIVQYVR